MGFNSGFKGLISFVATGQSSRRTWRTSKKIYTLKIPFLVS